VGYLTEGLQFDEEATIDWKVHMRLSGLVVVVVLRRVDRRHDESGNDRERFGGGGEYVFVQRGW